MKKMLRNKKGNVFDSFDTIKGMIFLVFVLIIVGVIVSNFYSEGESQGFFVGDDFEASSSYFQNFGANNDWVAPVLYGLLLLASLIFAHNIPSNTVYFVIAMIAIPFIGLAIIIMQTLSNLIWETTAVADMTIQMPITQFMMTGNIPLILGIIYMILTLIALYAGKDE
jgi:hypothetical protein